MLGVPESGSHMNAEAPAGSQTKASEALAASNLVALATTMTTMQRLLARRDADGGLVPAEAAMIQLAVESALVELLAVAEKLTALPGHLTNAQGISVATLLKAIADIEVVLDVLADAVGKVRA